MRKLILLLMALSVVGILIWGLFQFIEKDKSVNTEASNFEIYLIKGPDGYGLTSKTSIDFSKEKLMNLTLEDEPILTGEDLSAYHWKVSKNEDKLELREGISLEERINKRGGAITQHFPFVVVVNGERIYAGVFYSLLSSMMPPSGFKVSIDYLVPTSENEYLIVDKSDSDLIHDNRIYIALKKINKLQ